MDPVKRLRKKVKENDETTVRTFAARMELTDDIGKLKKKLGVAVYDPKVERANIENAKRLAGRMGIPRAMVESVMRTVIAESRLRQEAARLGPRKRPAGENISWHFPPPREFRAAIPRSEKAGDVVEAGRSVIRNILDGKDRRAILIMGPCSIHDPGEAEEYARRMHGLQKKVDDKLLLVMRAYVEKSRTGKGWTGFLADPYLDGTGDVQEGITASRKLLNRLAELGVPTAVEFISPMAAQYIGDLVSWAAVGARSSGTQTHRDMASGLDMPVGFKNGLDGSIGSATGAVEYASRGHTFLGADDSGRIGAMTTNGNPYCHLVLRGGGKPNYSREEVKAAQKAMAAAGLRTQIIVDCSHGNSGKVAANQIGVFNDVARQMKSNPNIVGMMLESHLEGGKQKLPEDLAGFNRSKLRRGVSVTDECLGWKETEKLILEACEGSIRLGGRKVY